MGKNIILKSLLRKPIIAILLTLLIGLVAYGFVGKAVETIIVWRETNRLEGYYRSIGYITKDWEGEEHSYAEGAALIEQSPSVAFGDLRKQTAGFMQDYYNTDFDSGTMDVPDTPFTAASLWYGEGVYNLDYWFYGTLVHYEKVFTTKKPILFSGYLLVFKVDNVLAGYPERIQANNNYAIWIPARFTNDFEKMASSLDLMEQGQRYFLRAWSYPNVGFVVSGVDAVNIDNAFNLKAIDDDSLWYIPVAERETIDLSMPQFDTVRLEIERLNQNLRSIMLIGTNDMSAMPEVQLDSKNLFLVEGRWLNNDDEIQAKPVIVISKNLAKTRNLELGDHMTITMRSLKDPYFSYIRSKEDIERWKTYPYQTKTYEVVGIYSDPYMEAANKNENFFSTSYVPNATMPDQFAFPIDWSKIEDKHLAYSFILTNPRLQDSFIEELTPKLKEIGFTLKFNDNNGKNFMASADPLRKSTLNGSFLYIAALLLAIGLTVFLYLFTQRRNYAIQRALGVTAGVSNKQLILPLLGLGLIGSLVGAILSWQIALKKAAESLSRLPLPSGVEPELTLNPAFGLGCWILILFALGMAVHLGSRRVTHTPVLALLQDKSNQKASTKADSSSAVKELDSRLLIQHLSDANHGNVNPNIALYNYSKWNTVRSPLKSLLTVVVAAALLLALGWLSSLIQSNKREISRLYKSAQIQVDFLPMKNEENSLTNMIKHEAVTWMEESGFVEDSYLATWLDVNGEIDQVNQTSKQIRPYGIIAVNNLDKALSKILKGSEINFASGYGAESFSEVWSESDIGKQALPLVVPKEIVDYEGWKLGQELVLDCQGLPEPVTFVLIGTYIGGDFVYIKTVDEHFFVGQHLITNLSAIELSHPGKTDYYEASFFTSPDMNYRLEEFKHELIEKQVQSRTFPETIQFWDEELLAVIEPMGKNLSLMERLYPVSLLLCGVIPGVLCLLLVLNRAKEIAILRMLGVSKANVRNMQIIQNLVFGLIGLALGTICLIFLRSVDVFQLPVGMAALIYITGCFLGSLTGASVVSNKKPMELLQVKE